MGRSDKDREHSGHTIQLPTDLIKNPLLLIILSLASGGTGVTLFVDKNAHTDVTRQLEAVEERSHALEDRMLSMQEAFRTQCTGCGAALELNYPLRTKLFEVGEDVKSIKWQLSRLSEQNEAHRNEHTSTPPKGNGYGETD